MNVAFRGTDEQAAGTFVTVNAGPVGSWWEDRQAAALRSGDITEFGHEVAVADLRDRKSTRLNSSHANISYAVFCLKKKINSPLPLSPTYPASFILHLTHLLSLSLHSIHPPSYQSLISFLFSSFFSCTHLSALMSVS